MNHPCFSSGFAIPITLEKFKRLTWEDSKDLASSKARNMKPTVDLGYVFNSYSIILCPKSISILFFYEKEREETDGEQRSGNGEKD